MYGGTERIYREERLASILGEMTAQMEFQQVRYFLALSRTLNFTRAADECNVTQPALTRAIKSLEGELGGELIRRERRLTHLTDLGQRLLPMLQQCYDSALSAKALAKAVKAQNVAPLTIVISQTVNTALITEALAEISRAYPGIQLTVRRDTRKGTAERLKEGDVDLALSGELEGDWDRLDTWVLFEEPYEVMANEKHSFASAVTSEIELKDLLEEKLLVCSDCEKREEVGAVLREQGYELSTAHQFEGEADLISLLEADLGVAIVPVSGPSSNSMQRLKLIGLALNRSVAVYAVSGRQRSAVAGSFLNLLRSADWSQYEH